MISSQTIERKEESERGIEKKQKLTFLLKVGDLINPLDLETISGKVIRIPDPKRKIHLQFRRYAGCPVCNLHMRSIAKRNNELLASEVREVTVFHSTRETMLEFQGQLPFDTVAESRKGASMQSLEPIEKCLRFRLSILDRGSPRSTLLQGLQA